MSTVQYAAVTGASEGIGLAIARLLAEKGYSLILTARNGEKLQQLKKEWEPRYGISVEPCACDLTKQDDVLRFFQTCVPYAPTVFINNAGMGKVGDFADTPLKDDLATLRLNTEAAHVLLKLFVQTMEKGRILNTASLAGLLPGPGMAAYAASKSYVITLSRSINYELKRSGKKITVSTFLPGPVNTGFDKKAGVTRTRTGIFAFGSLTPETCAKYAVKGMLRGKELICPGLPNKILHLGSKFLPTGWLLPIEYRIQKNKTKS